MIFRAFSLLCRWWCWWTNSSQIVWAENILNIMGWSPRATFISLVLNNSFSESGEETCQKRFCCLISSLCNIKISITCFKSNPGMDAIFHSFLSERGDPGNVSIGGGNSFGNPGGKRWDVLKIESLLLMFPPLQCTNSGKEKVCRRCWAKRSSPRKLQKQLQMGGSTTSWTSFASIEQNLSCLKFSPPGTRCWLASSPPQRRLWRTPTANVQLNERWSLDEFHNHWTVKFSIGLLFFVIQWFDWFVFQVVCCTRSRLSTKYIMKWPTGGKRESSIVN